jgi:steroid delta-isomerase-like uncharacterized protein
MRALAPRCRLYLAEPEGAADGARSFAKGTLDHDFIPDTICDGLRGTLGAINFDILRSADAQVLTVDDAQVVAAMRLLWTRTKQLVEPSSATTLAAVHREPPLFEGRRVGIILSGGNVDLDALPALFANGITPMKIDGTRAHDRATELVLAYYAAFNRGDWAGMQALLAEDVQHDLNQGRARNRQARLRGVPARMERSYREQLRDVVVMASPDGARAAAEYVVHGEYLVADDGLPPANGQRYVLPGGAFFEIVFDKGGAGLIARVTNYYNLEDWLAQVR